MLGKALALQAQGLQLELQHPRKKLGIVAHAYNPRAGIRVKIGGSLEIRGQPV